MSWLKEVIGTEKAIIAMCHLDPLPGDPSYGPGSTMEQVIENARKDLLALQNGGVDAVMFSNEFSLPYLTQVETVTVAAMARIIGALFAVIGTTYGSGDGSTTFNLPNLTDRFLQGSTSVGTVKNAGLPNITGSVVRVLRGAYGANGALLDGDPGGEAIQAGGSGVDSASISIDASRSNSIYGNSSTVQPPALTCLICIKY